MSKAPAAYSPLQKRSFEARFLQAAVLLRFCGGAQRVPNSFPAEDTMKNRLMIAALSGLLLAFTLSASAITEAELEAAKREAEYAKAKADVAEQQAREAKGNADRMKYEKGIPRAGAVSAAAAAAPPADLKAATPAPKPAADSKNVAPKK